MQDEVVPPPIEVDGIVYLVDLPVVVTAVVMYHIHIIAVAEGFEGQTQSVVEQIVVCIGKDDVSATGMAHAVVACRRHPLVLLADKSEVGMACAILLADGHAAIRGAVAHQNHLILTVAQPLAEYRVETFPQVLLHIIYGNDNRDYWVQDLFIQLSN